MEYGEREITYEGMQSDRGLWILLFIKQLRFGDIKIFWDRKVACSKKGGAESSSITGREAFASISYNIGSGCYLCFLVILCHQLFRIGFIINCQGYYFS